MLPPHSDHQSERLLHSSFLGCVSGGLLGFSHEDVIDFDIGAHGSNSVYVYYCMLFYTLIVQNGSPDMSGDDRDRCAVRASIISLQDLL